MMNAILILNPASRAGRGRRHWAAWQAGLRRAGIALECRETSDLSDAQRLAAQAGQAGLVVAVGGDGTINGVLSGLMDLPAPRPAMGVLYAGTSPDFCRFHDIPTDPALALETLLAGRERAVDVARVGYRDSGGARRVAFFGDSANIGIGARVAEFANRWRPRLGDGLGTALAVLRALRGPHPHLTVELDDAPPFALPRCCNLTVAKNPFIASGLKFDAALAPDDGALAVLGIHSRGLAGLLRLFPAFYRGRVPETRGVFRSGCRRAAISADMACPIEFDGDPHGFLPAEIEIEPRALRLIVRSAP